MARKPTSLSLDPQTLVRIDARPARHGGGRSGAVSEIVNDFSSLTARAINLARIKFTQPEAVFVTAMLDGTFVEIAAFVDGGLAHEAEDAVKFAQLDEEKFDFDGPFFLEKINSARDLELLGLLEFARGYWATPSVERGSLDDAAKIFTPSADRG